MPIPIDGKRKGFTLDEIANHLREGIYGAYDFEILELNPEFERAVRHELGADLAIDHLVTVRDIKMFLKKRELAKKLNEVADKVVVSPRQITNVRVGPDGTIYGDVVLDAGETVSMEMLVSGSLPITKLIEEKPKWQPENSPDTDWS